MTTTPDARTTTVAVDAPAATNKRPAYAQWAIAIVVAGVLLRVAVLLVGLPPTNSDEATMGLMARHIAAGQAAPVWFYGQQYMGSLEAWLAAPLFALFGSSTWLLRLQNLVWYALLLVVVYQLAVRLYAHRVALVSIGLLALGSDRIFANQLLAGGGYPEIVPMIGALFLIAVLLTSSPRPAGRRRTVLFGLWGLIAGVALWDHWIALPYLAAAGIVLFAFARPDFVRLPGAALFTGLLTGAAPMLVDNLTGRTNSVRWLLYLNNAGHDKLSDGTVGDHLYNGFLIGVPMGTGLCQPNSCLPVALGWGVVYPLALLAAAGLAVVALRRVPGPARVRHAVRLALALAGVLTMISYARSPASVLHPIESNRYLALLGVTLPVLVGTLGFGLPRLRLVGRAVLAGVFVLATIATVTAFGGVAVADRLERRQAELIAALDRERITGIYSDYWTCARLTFAVDERIACATIEDGLKPGHDRYLPYRARVDADPTRAYALRAGWRTEREFLYHVQQRQVPVTVYQVDGYRIYRPASPLDVPRPGR